MAPESRSRLIAGSVVVAILAGLAALIAVATWSGGKVASSGSGNVRIVTAAVPDPARPIPVSQPNASIMEAQAKDPKEFAATLIKHFPSIREASLVCEDECKLVAALGDQTLGPTPFDGNLERFLVEQGCELNGDLVIDQPGDNDTLLTIPVNGRSIAQRIETNSMNLPTNR